MNCRLHKTWLPQSSNLMSSDNLILDRTDLVMKDGGI